MNTAQESYDPSLEGNTEQKDALQISENEKQRAFYDLISARLNYQTQLLKVANQQPEIYANIQAEKQAKEKKEAEKQEEWRKLLLDKQNNVSDSGNIEENQNSQEGNENQNNTQKNN